MYGRQVGRKARAQIRELWCARVRIASCCRWPWCRAQLPFMALVQRRSAGPRGRPQPGPTHLSIKAINKIIVLVILFQGSGLLAHPAAAAKVNFAVVAGGDGHAPSGGRQKHSPDHQARQPRAQQPPPAPHVARKGATVTGQCGGGAGGFRPRQR